MSTIFNRCHKIEHPVGFKTMFLSISTNRANSQFYFPFDEFTKFNNILALDLRAV